jgi:mRNA interferase RelE/StbE
MPYNLEFTESARRELRALDGQLQRRISGKIHQLCEEPFPPGVKKLLGLPDHYRIRVGAYRVIYRVDGRRVGDVTWRSAIAGKYTGSRS